MSGPGNPDTQCDVLVVGGGVAGSTLALVLARGGLTVTVLERQQDYIDRVRGEYMHPWGVAEAQRLEIEDVLLEAGAVFVTRAIGYEESIPSAASEANARNMASLLPGIRGGLGIGHPAACRALSRAAESAGAKFVRETGSLDLTFGASPAAEYEKNGERRRVNCRLIVGADGRNSTVRRRAGISLEADDPTHLFSGLLIGDASGWPRDTYAVGYQGALQYQIFPQGSDRVRLYTSTSSDQRRRYAGGSDGRARFLADFAQASCIPLAEVLSGGAPLGPCATFTGEDTWTDVPFADGVVLIGDAAGFNDPIIGQGLSLALADARSVSEILLSGEDWSPKLFTRYGDERRERARRTRCAARLMVEIYAVCRPEGAARRQGFIRRLGDSEFRGRALLTSLAIGPERSPEWIYNEGFRTAALSAS